MSNNGEDIIRETFEKFGDAIGVQMQVPAAMIANLGAVLQAQIDLLAELQSTGRLIPTGGMALTAEQVEDVRTEREGLRGYRNFDGNARGRVNRLIAAVDALFPATEPAEGGLGDVDPLDPQGRTYRETGAQHWMTTPAPAEPAEEETKALPAEVGSRIRASVTRWSSALEWPDSNPYIDTFVLSGSGFWDAENDQFTVVPSCFSYIEVLEVLPPPVVPAPTETGPWQRIEDVPEGVLQIKDRHGRTWLVVGGTWRFEWHDGNWYEPHTNINAQAPFVAAEEG